MLSVDSPQLSMIPAKTATDGTEHPQHMKTEDQQREIKKE